MDLASTIHYRGELLGKRYANEPYRWILSLLASDLETTLTLKFFDDGKILTR